MKSKLNKKLLIRKMETFLSDRITMNPNQYTHQSMFWKKKYIIEEQDLEKFYSMYQDDVKKGEFVSLCERPRPTSYTTIRADFDIKIPEQYADQFVHDSKLYTDREVMEMVEMHQMVLSKFVKDLSPNQLMCCVLEKGTIYKKDGFIKSGFHLEFPFLLF